MKRFFVGFRAGKKMALQLFNPGGEIRYAGTAITLDDVVVAKVTSFSRSLTVAEENVTGAEDIVDGGDILEEKFVAISVGETAQMEGIAIAGDPGQSALKTAAETGAEVDIEHILPTGEGKTLTGFFTNYEERGSITEVYKFSGTFRVNSKADIVPAG